MGEGSDDIPKLEDVRRVAGAPGPILVDDGVAALPLDRRHGGGLIVGEALHHGGYNPRVLGGELVVLAWIGRYVEEAVGLIAWIPAVPAEESVSIMRNIDTRATLTSNVGKSQCNIILSKISCQS